MWSKKILSDYPRGVFFRRPGAVSDALAITPALLTAFVFSRPGGPVTLLRFPARPCPRRLPAGLAAITRTRPRGPESLFAAFQQTNACAGTPKLRRPVFPIFDRTCRILDRPHGSWPSRKLMPRRGSHSAPGRQPLSGSAQTHDSIAAVRLPFFPRHAGAAQSAIRPVPLLLLWFHRRHRPAAPMVLPTAPFWPFVRRH